jgi:hypothetical protein
MFKRFRLETFKDCFIIAVVLTFALYAGIAIAQQAKTLIIKETGSPTVVAIDGKDLSIGTDFNDSPGDVYILRDGVAALTIDSTGANITGALSPDSLTIDGGDINFADVTATDDHKILSSTSDADDDAQLSLCSGGACTSSRGGFLTLHGNEDGNGGSIFLHTGTDSGADIILNLDGTTSEFEIEDDSNTDLLKLEQDGDLFLEGTFYGNSDITLRANADDVLVQAVDDIIFFTNIGGAAVERLRINHGNGSVGVSGTTQLATLVGTDLPNSPVTGSLFVDTNDDGCDDANDSAGNAVCIYDGSAWIQLD